MHGEFDAHDTVHEFVNPVHGERRGCFRIPVMGAHGGIHKQAEVRIVYLRNICSGVTDEFEFATQERHAGLNEVFSTLVGFAGLLLIPHSLTEESRRRKGRFYEASADGFKKCDFAGHKTQGFWRKLIHDNGEWPAIRQGADLEPVRDLSDYSNVRFSPPLAIRQNVKSRLFLQSNSVSDGGTHALLTFVRRQRGSIID